MLVSSWSGASANYAPKRERGRKIGVRRVNSLFSTRGVWNEKREFTRLTPIFLPHSRPNFPALDAVWAGVFALKPMEQVRVAARGFTDVEFDLFQAIPVKDVREEACV